MSRDQPLGRRKLLVAAGATGALGGAAALGYYLTREAEPLPAPQNALDPETVRGFYRRLGRTGLSVSAVSIGGGGLEGPEPLIRAVESGLNYIDTSVCYGDSELVIADALRRKPSLRDKLIIATKWDVDTGWDRERI